MADLIKLEEQKWLTTGNGDCSRHNCNYVIKLLKQAKAGDTIGELVLVKRSGLLTEDNLAHLRSAMASANRNESKTGDMKLHKCEYCEGLMNDKLKALTLKEKE